MSNSVFWAYETIVVWNNVSYSANEFKFLSPNKISFCLSKRCFNLLIVSTALASLYWLVIKKVQNPSIAERIWNISTISFAVIWWILNPLLGIISINPSWLSLWRASLIGVLEIPI